MRRTTALPLPVARRAALRVRPMRRGRVPLWVWVGVVGLSLAALLPVVQSSDATQAGAQLRDLERERAALHAEVRLLASQVGELTALNRIGNVAQERLGLTPARPTTVLSVDVPPPVALLPTRFLPTRDLPVEQALPAWQRWIGILIVR